MINRPSFYGTIRASLFKKLMPTQVEGIEALFNEWDKREFTDPRKLAYILATIYHETGAKMKPVREFGGEKYLKSKAYYPYYGRDLVQTTWLANYKKVKAFTGVDVVGNPELISNLPIAAATAIEFMMKGYYTGKKLSDYFDDQKEEPITARKIINGVDKAVLIASYYRKFLEALTCK